MRDGTELICESHYACTYVKYTRNETLHKTRADSYVNE